MMVGEVALMGLNHHRINCVSHDLMMLLWLSLSLHIKTVPTSAQYAVLVLDAV